jgi:hypothetical protein
VKAGDRVLFGKYSGTEIKIDGEELLIVREGKKTSASSRNNPLRLELLACRAVQMERAEAKLITGN